MRINGKNDVCENDCKFLEKTYGRNANGNDGGAFIEFRNINPIKNNVPKYIGVYDENYDDAIYAKRFISFVITWRRSLLTDNAITLMACFKHHSEFFAGFGGGGFVVVFTKSVNDFTDDRQASVTVHEVGHSLGIHSGTVEHVDGNIEYDDCMGVDKCIMSYSSDVFSSEPKLCIDCLDYLRSLEKIEYDK